IEALVWVRNDADGDWSAWSEPGVFEDVERVLSALAESAKKPDDATFWYSKIVGFAWQVRRYDVGRRALDKTDGKTDRIAFREVATPGDRAAAGTYAMTGPHADDVRAAEQDVEIGKADDAIKRYADLAAATDASDRGKPWYTGRRRELVSLQKFNAGEQVNLMPEGDGDLSGWSAVRGDWS